MTEIAETFSATVLGGPMVAALPIALLAGLVSFASPCVLPLLPGYIGYFGGMAGTSARGGGAPRGASGRLLAGVLLFVAGFTAVFVLLSVAFAWLGGALAAHSDVIMRLLGVVVVLMGLVFMGRVPFLQREQRLHLSPRAGLWGAPVLGVVFGLGWAPCIGPTLAAVLTLSLDSASTGRGATLALAYCLGLGLPFVLFAALFSRSRRALQWLRRHRRAISTAGGAMLVLLGLALVTGLWDVVAGHLQGWAAGFRTVI